MALPGIIFVRAPMIAISSLPKSGTHLLATIVELINGKYPGSLKKGRRPSDLMKFDLRNPDFVGHFRLRNLQENRLLMRMFMKRRVLVLIRDPRDICQSFVSYIEKSRQLDHVALAEALDGFSYEEKIRKVAEGFYSQRNNVRHSGIEKSCRGFIEIHNTLPNSTLLRYEDFFDEKRVPSILSSFLGVSYESAYKATDIALNSATRTRARGVPSIWKTLFSPELQQYFRDQYGDLIDEMGYEP